MPTPGPDGLTANATPADSAADSTADTTVDGKGKTPEPAQRLKPRSNGHASGDADVRADDSGDDCEGDSIKFSCLDASMDGPTLLDCCNRVTADCSRIELRMEDGNIVVLISKCELDSLEEALELLAQSSDCSKMRHELTHLAHHIETNLLMDAGLGMTSGGVGKSDVEAN